MHVQFNGYAVRPPTAKSAPLVRPRFGTTDPPEQDTSLSGLLNRLVVAVEDQNRLRRSQGRWSKLQTGLLTAILVLLAGVSWRFHQTSQSIDTSIKGVSADVNAARRRVDQSATQFDQATQQVSESVGDASQSVNDAADDLKRGVDLLEKLQQRLPPFLFPKKIKPAQVTSKPTNSPKN